MIKISWKSFGLFILVGLLVALLSWQTQRELRRLSLEEQPIPLASPTSQPDTSNLLKIPQSQSALSVIQFWERDGGLTDGEKVIYEFPPELLQALTETNPTWSSDIVSAVPVPQESGRYYLSTSAMTNDRTDPPVCGSANKIYILDTLSNRVSLLYEENNETIPASDIVRGCNKDMNLIATLGTQLIFKYHTWETGGPCDATWADPEITYYLDTANLTQGTKKFAIPDELHKKALTEVQECQDTL